MAVHRFPPFEFDPATLQLWKNGHPVKLQRKPALVLAALLENHGEPLARPEICARLWPAGTFVDFELSLNVAVKKLRDSLDDSADQPQFIQTIAGQGYRFIGRCDSLFLAQPSVIEPPLPPLISAAPRRFRFGSAAILALVPVFVASAFMATSKPPVSYRAANFRQITHSGTEKTPFATDGERIYFFELRGDQTSLTQTSVNGGDELRLPASASVLPYQADVRGDQMVYLDGNWSEYFQANIGAQVWIRHLPAGAAWQVPGVRCQSVSWTSEGQLLCTLGGRFEIVDIQGKLIKQLFSVKHLAFRAHLSPDQKRVRFDMSDDSSMRNGWGVWDASINATDLHRLVPKVGNSCCGNWSNDGMLYVFEVWNGTRWDLWTLPQSSWFVRNPQAIQLTSGPLDARYPRFSADGSQVYFMGADFRGELSAVDEKTGELVPYLTGDSITQVDFSPDRKWITYVAYPEGTLWRSRPDGTERLQLTKAPLLAYSPRFSRDARQIFFSDIAGKSESYSVSIDGGELKFLFKATAECVSPRDAHIDVPFLTWCPAGTDKDEIRLIDPAAGTSQSIPDSGGMQNAVLSPDGQAIAGIREHSGKLRIFRLNSQRWTEMPIPITDNPGVLAWSPQRDAVYLQQERAILRCWIKSKRTEVVIRLPRCPSSLWWSNRITVSPEGKLLLTRQTGAGDIYAFDLQRH